MASEGPVLDQVNIVVRDMEASAAFYGRLGVTVPVPDGRWAAFAPHHRSATGQGAVDLDLDSAAFARQWDAGWPEGRGGVVVGFRVATRDAVDRLYSELTAAGAPGQQPPFDAFWGSRYAVVEDPDGNAVGLMSPRDPSRRSESPEPPQ